MIPTTCNLVTIAFVGLAGGLETHLSVKPIEPIQHRIEKAFNTAVESKSAAEAFGAIGSLQDLTDDPGEDVFFAQLFYYYVRQDDPSDARAELKQRWVLKSIDILAISETAIAQSAYPCLESDQPRLRSIGESFLNIAEATGVSEAPDFSHYRALLDFSNPPWPLVEHMFQKSPERAFLTLLGMRQRHLNSKQHQKLRLGQHLIEDAVWKQMHEYPDEFARVKHAAMTELEQFAAHSEWWVRLYAAEIVARRPELRTAQLIERLRKDENQLVREVVVQKMDE